MTNGTRGRLGALVLLLFVGAMAAGCIAWLVGCHLSPEQLAQLKAASAEGHDELAALEADLSIVEDPHVRAWLQARIDQVRPMVEQLDEAIQEAESGDDLVLGLVELGLGAAAVAFPPASAALLAVRALRRRKRALGAVFESVRAGGGPKEPEAAKSALRRSPEGYAEFLAWKYGPAPTAAPPFLTR